MFASQDQNTDSGHACLSFAGASKANSCLTSGFVGGNTEVVFGPMPSNVTISRLMAQTNGTATNQVVTVLDNGVATALGCTNTTGSACTDTTDSVSVAAGHFLQVQVTGGTASRWNVTFVVG
jgi:hypothetical protein